METKLNKIVKVILYYIFVDLHLGIYSTNQVIFFLGSFTGVVSHYLPILFSVIKIYRPERNSLSSHCAYLFCNCLTLIATLWRLMAFRPYLQLSLNYTMHFSLIFDSNPLASKQIISVRFTSKLQPDLVCSIWVQVNLTEKLY